MLVACRGLSDARGQQHGHITGVCCGCNCCVRICMQVVGDLRQTPKGWFLVPVGQLTTQQREYTALHRAAATEVPLPHASVM